MKAKIRYVLAGLLFASAVHAQQGPPPGPPPSPEARLKQVTAHLEKALVLKPDQKQKVHEAYQKFFAGIEKLREGQPAPPPPPMPPGKKEDIDKLAKARDESIKKALNSTQFKKYQEIEKNMRPGGRRPGGPPPPPTGN